MTRKPRTAKPARQPTIPPTTAAVLTDPEEPAVEEGVADVLVPVPRMILVCDVGVEVVCKVTTAVGVVVSAVCVTRDEDVDEVEVLEDEVPVLEDVDDEDVVEEDEVVGTTEAEDCWVDVAAGVVEAGVVVVAGAEVVLDVSDFCVAEACAVVAVVKIDCENKDGVNRAAMRMW